MGVLRAAIIAVFILATITGVGLEARAWAPVDQSEHVPQRAIVASASLSMDQAVKMAEQRFKAKVVRAESLRQGIHIIYILKLLNDAGHVWTVRVDAANGAIL